ncbi:MAG: TadE/TadG family type IV pilus assembly protein [Pseudomonadota bacterium]
MIALKHKRFSPFAVRLRRDRQGVTALEFTLVAPVFLLLIMGIFDVGQMAYGLAVLNGSVQKAARDSALETANVETIDNIVKRQVSPIFPGATYRSTRTSYTDFIDIGRAERWNDANNDDECNNNESYVDENDNGRWDAEIGESGNGGASDVVIYRFTVNYTSTFAVPFMPDTWNERELTATAIRKNQPFATQDGYGSTAGTCS